jgi:uncharacterized protein with PIN domain
MGGVAATMRIDAALRFFLAPRDRHGIVTVAVDGTSTITHVIESIGVPRTEWGELRRNGQPAPGDARPADGDVIDVPVRPRPQRLTEERFVLDVHLGSLARRMRLLGLDVAYQTHASDDDLVDQAARQNRVLLTKDRGILRRRALADGAYVLGDRPDQQLDDVLDRFAPRLRPWQRCPACNGVLEHVAKLDIAEKLPPGTRRSYARFSRCRSCGRIYWRGAHSRRLDALVESARSRG